MDEDDLKRFKEYVERTRHERSGSKEIAFQYLYEHGYIDANGDLTPRYGGPRQPGVKPRKYLALSILLFATGCALIAAVVSGLFR